MCQGKSHTLQKCKERSSGPWLERVSLHDHGQTAPQNQVAAQQVAGNSTLTQHELVPVLVEPGFPMWKKEMTMTRMPGTRSRSRGMNMHMSLLCGCDAVSPV